MMDRSSRGWGAWLGRVLVLVAVGLGACGDDSAGGGAGAGALAGDSDGGGLVVGDGDGDGLTGDGDGDVGDGLTGDGDVDVGDGDGTGDGDAGDGDAGDGDNAGACASDPSRLLVLFDLSGSMVELFVGSTTRLDAAHLALDSVLSEYDPSLQVALLHFPTALCLATLPAGEVVVNPIDSEPQLGFQPVEDFRTTWASYFDNDLLPMGLGTPMQEAFDRASDALGDLSGAPPTAVVLVTDGAGNCLVDTSVSGPTQLETEHTAAWAAAGVATWVVSLAPPLDDGMPDPLVEIANAAGTIKAQPTTQDELTTALRAAIDSVGCRQ